MSVCYASRQAICPSACQVSCLSAISQRLDHQKPMWFDTFCHSRVTLCGVHQVHFRRSGWKIGTLGVLDHTLYGLDHFKSERSWIFLLRNICLFFRPPCLSRRFSKKWEVKPECQVLVQPHAVGHCAGDKAGCRYETMAVNPRWSC